LKIPPFDWLRVVSEVEPPEAGVRGQFCIRNKCIFIRRSLEKLKRERFYRSVKL
jgi:hypothetical protein